MNKMIKNLFSWSKSPIIESNKIDFHDVFGSSFSFPIDLWAKRPIIRKYYDVAVQTEKNLANTKDQEVETIIPAFIAENSHNTVYLANSQLKENMVSSQGSFLQISSPGKFCCDAITDSKFDYSISVELEQPAIKEKSFIGEPRATLSYNLVPKATQQQNSETFPKIENENLINNKQHNEWSLNREERIFVGFKLSPE